MERMTRSTSRGSRVRPCASIVRCVLVACCITLPATPLRAQITGVPVFHSMKHDPNNSIHVDWGHATGDLDGDYLGARFTRAVGGATQQAPLRISAMAGGMFTDAQDALALGVSAGLALLPRHLVQMEPSIGIGWNGGDASFVNVPISVAIGLVGSLPPSGVTRFVSENQQLWIAPRAQFRYADDASGDRVVRGGGGAAIGLELRWLRGYGLQIEYETIAMRDATGPRWRRESAFGLSLFFAWL
jgi:hypothetical protein